MVQHATVKKFVPGVGILCQAMLAGAAEPVQSTASFTSAIQNTSTSLSYVAITVADSAARRAP